jgi:hypothetical protein
MKVYKPVGSEGYELCHPENKGGFEQISTLINGEKRGESWVPIRMRIINFDEGVVLRPSDSPWLGASYALIFRKKAIDALRPLLEVDGELLPLSCPGHDLWIYNTFRVLDALDEDASTVMRLKSGKPFMIQEHVFRPEIVKNVPIFKISLLSPSPTYVNESFLERWRSSGLHGLDFTGVWSHGSA